MQMYRKKIGGWMRAAVGAAVSRELKVMRFGDNMRQVAVTEGDKVEVQMKLGWQVNTYAVGDLVEVMNQVSEQEIDSLMKEYQQNYEFATDDMETVRYQAREEIAIQKMLDEHGCGAYTNTFEDLWGMEQLPGIASQDLMAKGYGYGGEGDWKVSALTHIMKQMSEGVPGGTASWRIIPTTLSRARSFRSVRICWRSARLLRRKSRASRYIRWVSAARLHQHVWSLRTSGQRHCRFADRYGRPSPHDCTGY